MRRPGESYRGAGRKKIVKPALGALEEELQICCRQALGGLPSWHNVIQRTLTIPAVHLQKPLALGGQKLLVFGSLLGLPFELSPAALQILHLFMEQRLGPITFQGKMNENQRAHVSTLAWWVGGLIDTLNPTRKPVGATSLLAAELVVLSDPTNGSPLSTSPVFSFV